jgi:glyoxylase-like metal-dependent hydrolase (beta-lactamase superfamily II)
VHVAERWFERREVAEGVLRLTEPHVLPLIRANLYLVRGHDRDMLVDSGLGIASLRDELADLVERPIVAVATHRHYDHVGGLHEFPGDVVAHRDDADAILTSTGLASLLSSDYPPEELASLEAAGYELPEVLLEALPYEGYDPSAYGVVGVTPTRVVDEGDVIDLGDRRFEVLHLPGHTPGEIGLWEAETGTLFSGDAVYESGDLLDELPESSIPDYVRTMRRLRDVPVTVVHGGHDESFGRMRLDELIDDYLALRTST